MNLNLIIEKYIEEKKEYVLGTSAFEQNLKTWYEEKKKLGWDKAINHRNLNAEDIKKEILDIVKDSASKISDQTEKKYELELKKQKTPAEVLFWVFSKLQVVYGNKVIK